MNRYLNYMGTAVSIAVLVIVISVLFGTFFNRPVLVSYVLSESMEPTLMTGDVIFINPFAANANINDIIVFKSGQNYVVHRIVGVTAEGFITKGDNNIATDQLSEKPYVQEEDIVGRIIMLGSHPVAIPGGGEFIKGISSEIGNNKIALIALLIIFGLYFTLGDESAREKKRNKGTVKIGFPVIYFIFSILILIIISLSMVMVAEERYIEYSTTVAIGSKNPDWVTPGAVFERELDIGNYGKYPYYYKLEIISPRLSLKENSVFLMGPGGEKKIVAKIQAPAETSLNAERIRIWKILPLLPPQLIEWSFGINPYLAILAIDLEIASLLAVVYFISGGQNERPIRFKANRTFRLLRSSLSDKIDIIGG